MSIYVKDLHYPPLQILTIFDHFSQFQLKHFLSQPIMEPTFYNNCKAPQNFFHFYESVLGFLRHFLLLNIKKNIVLSLKEVAVCIIF